MPTYNGAAYLPAALDSLVSQGRSDFEVIAVDDGSTDATKEILRSYASRLSLKIISRQHEGNWIANTNVGMAATEGRYLCILHQDDIWAPHRVRELARLIARWPEARLVLHPARFINSRGKQVGLWRCPLPNAARYLRPREVLERLLVQDFLGACAPVFRKDTAVEVGWMDEGLWYTGDWDFWLKLARVGRTLYHPSPLISFRIHPLSQTSLGANGSEELRRQYAAVLSRHLPTCQWSQSDLKHISRIAWFSADMNLALMRMTNGQPVDWLHLCSRFVKLGTDGWYRFLRDSRIMDRGSSRLRAGLVKLDARAVLLSVLDSCGAGRPGSRSSR